MTNYSFMTCNVRLQNPEDGAQQFLNRVDYLTEFLNEKQPDVIGLQELKPEMRLLMMERMPDYAFLGGGRDEARLDESPAIVYRRMKFMPERLSTEILSFTPLIPGTTYGGDQSICPRAFCTADLMPIEGGQPFRFVNVHTDYLGPKSREYASLQILQNLSIQNTLRPMPTVITGDFNATPDSTEIRMISENRTLSFTDVTASIGGTYHEYDRLKEAKKIDYIFVSDEWKLLEVESFHKKKGELFLSDHDPVLAKLCLIK